MAPPERDTANLETCVEGPYAEALPGIGSTGKSLARARASDAT